MVKLYVEGGGDAAALKVACRAAFNTFITKAGITKRPRIVACGGRQDAYDSFCTAIGNGEEAVLLVDSEAAVANQHQSGQTDKWLPWGHLLVRDKWNKPTGSNDTDCHLMVQVMESWFLVDQAALQTFFGQGFSPKALPAAATPIEGVTKAVVYSALEKATSGCKTKGSYGKGEHSFKLLASIDPTKVIAASPWAARFVDELQKKMK